MVAVAGAVGFSKILQGGFSQSHWKMLLSLGMVVSRQGLRLIWCSQTAIIEQLLQICLDLNTCLRFPRGYSHILQLNIKLY